MNATAELKLELDGEGFLVNRDDWNEDVARELARMDGYELTDEMLNYIREARRMYEEDGVVPPIRKFAKALNVSSKDLYDTFKKGPMKLICKWGALPKPTGCV
ncbi:TusE/DsrC/DsvC family sulfur relay protein [Thiohalobacter sp. IOR34]|uniref:TusE/DsrC/DsvC family sulfur relay protein n=1 Tax=Thiohalobacter sp. IOR34 TaxID=3057176 RepID=UPI0025AF7AF5|nr:TusE/DsrC/DsvC family sulfur relay protein [Thiohalobacter sp. IOR34]WJW76092.1 TusE/DsrC/DsvC family sulfur relay protein [Thiohalobacter sp. IOR34]